MIPVGEAQNEYSQNVFATLREAGIRAEVDTSNEGLGKKVRAAKVGKIPYYIVVGGKEVESNTVTVEHRDKGKVGEKTVEEFTLVVLEETKRRG